MYFLKAFILNRSGKRTQSKELPEKGLEIYESNCHPEHMKIIETRHRLGAIDNSR
ncbi:MAG: hypothetical protein ACJAXX_000484 [Roseivirga sp.]|jgi:hypothetical protein